jgi:hypothetical protein
MPEMRRIEILESVTLDEVNEIGFEEDDHPDWQKGAASAQEKVKDEETK